MRHWLAALVVVAGGMGGIFVVGARPAEACSRATFITDSIPQVVRQSQIVARGTVVESSERSATLRVEEGLKGTNPGVSYRIDNRTTYTAMACSPYDEPFHEGHRFAKGDRLVVMLEKEVDGLWQIAFGSWAAWQDPDDDLVAMVSEHTHAPRDQRTVDELKADIRMVAHLLNAEPEYETRPHCTYSSGNRLRVVTSSVVVLAEVRQGSLKQDVHVREVIAGKLDDREITVNLRVRLDYDKCRAVLNQPYDEIHSREGTFLLFLRPDEFGVADYRVASWGMALERVNEKYVTHGLPTLGDIRRATGQAVPVQGAGAAWLPGVVIAGWLGLAFAGWFVSSRTWRESRQG